MHVMYKFTLIYAYPHVLYTIYSYFIYYITRYIIHCIYTGKDRSAVGVTLDITTHLLRHHSLQTYVTTPKYLCSLLREHGVRRENIYINTKQTLYAFTHYDLLALPECYQISERYCSDSHYFS